MEYFALLLIDIRKQKPVIMRKRKKSNKVLSFVDKLRQCEICNTGKRNRKGEKFLNIGRLKIKDSDGTSSISFQIWKEHKKKELQNNKIKRGI